MERIKRIAIFLLLLHVASANAEIEPSPLIDAGKSHDIFSDAMDLLLGRHGKTKSPQAAFERFHLLADQGWRTAQLMLGNLYMKGEGVEKDMTQAYLWYSLAARQNFSLAREKAKKIRDNLPMDKLKEAENLIFHWQPKPKTVGSDSHI